MGGCLSWCFETVSGDEAPPRSITVNGKSYTILGILGEGGYSTVYRARDAEKEVALKRVRFASERRYIVEQEVKFLKMCQASPFVINMFDYEIKGGGNIGSRVRNNNGDNNEPAASGPMSSQSCDGEAWIVLELCGDSAFMMLQNKINQVRLLDRNAKAEGCLQLETIVQILDSAIHAVAPLHRMQPHPIAHWDIKLQNFLKAPANSKDLPEGAYKLCDFGSATQQRIAPCANARHVNAASIILDERFTLAYRPPESLDLWSRHAVDTKADMWAIGVMLYTMLCSRLPFEENARQIIDNAMIPFPENFLNNGHPFKNLVKIVKEGLLVTDPMQRWNIFDLSKKLHELYPSIHQPVEEPLGTNNTTSVMMDFPMPSENTN
jgi:serine/threonine protein kinase